MDYVVESCVLDLLVGIEKWCIFIDKFCSFFSNMCFEGLLFFIFRIQSMILLCILQMFYDCISCLNFRCFMVIVLLYKRIIFVKNVNSY